MHTPQLTVRYDENALYSVAELMGESNRICLKQGDFLSLQMGGRDWASHGQDSFDYPSRDSVKLGGVAQDDSARRV